LTASRVPESSANWQEFADIHFPIRISKQPLLESSLHTVTATDANDVVPVD
jgi:hypothetical protein